MDYNRPELGERLAADYVLGLMPRRSRRRFERVLARNASLAATVAAWSERLSPLDTLSDDEPPPNHIWQMVERRVGRGARAAPRSRSFALSWGGFGIVAAGACAVLLVYIALNPTRLPDVAEALGARMGLHGWVASAPRMPADIGLSTLQLGVSERERPRWLRAALLLTNEALPLTREPSSH